jgi:sugar transferase (PEP-CTERM/EpsH1 system associated)
MRIFVLLPRFPYPLEKGDKLRAFNQIKYLSKNHEIHLCALNDFEPKPEYIKALQPFCKSINVITISKFTIAWNIFKAIFNGKPFQVGYFYNCKARKKIHQLIRDINPDHIYCQLLRVAEYVNGIDIPKTLDYQDVFSKGVERRMETSKSYLKPILRMEYKRLLKYENVVFDRFDHKTIISIPDRKHIPHPDKDKIEIVLNGVDFSFFKPMEITKEYELVFIGNMGYPPNINASKFLANDILPLVHKVNPAVRLTLAGASPHPDVMALKNNKIHVTGWMEDIRESYAKADIFIAPMQIGTGLQNKLLEAMAMKIPCITSTLANKALEAKHEKEILVGNTAREFADHILRLLKNKEFAEEIAEKGYQFVRQNYDWDAATKKLEDLIISSKS